MTTLAVIIRAVVIIRVIVIIREGG